MTLRILFVAAIFIVCIACRKENIEPNNENKPQDTLMVEPTPADFDFNTTPESDTLNIAFVHDLNGQTITLPGGVFINAIGGIIINGTLIFENGIIDDDILNPDLNIGGTVSLKEPTFTFSASKWGITEGKVTDNIALVNKNHLQKAIDQAKYLKATTFKIDVLDAFFTITNEYYADAAIGIPSDFTMEMSENTILRVQPNNHALYMLFKIREVSNVTIRNGNLFGDRNEHDYTPVVMDNGVYSTTHEYGHCIEIKSGVNITIDNVKLANAIGDGIEISSLGFAYNPAFNPYKPSHTINIVNCIFDSNRRNNLSITDGYDIVVDSNEFLNAGINTPHSTGTAPRYGIDIEAYREKDSLGNLIYYQRARDIILKNNIEKGGANGAFIVAIGEDVTIENNSTEHSIGYTVGSGIRILKNTITSADRKMTAIFGGMDSENAAIYNNEIAYNVINNHSTGIMFWNTDTRVFGNNILDCVTGIKSVALLRNSEIYNNTIANHKELSYGIVLSNGAMDAVVVQNNNIDVQFYPVFVNEVNNATESEKGNTVTIQNNSLNGKDIYVANSNGIIIN